MGKLLSPNLPDCAVTIASRPDEVGLGSGVIALDVDDNNKRQYLLLDEVESPMIPKLLHVNHTRRKPRRIRTLDGGVGHAFRQDLVQDDSISRNGSPEQVLHYLCAVFPTFKDWWKDGETEILDAELGFHLIMAEFIQFFGVNHQSFSEKQLRRFGEWVNDAVLIDGPLENAISTCFLEQTRQVKINRVLAPYLSRVAKDRSHA